MAKDPAVLFYTSDFLSGTSFFTMQERGQYITLLCEQHQLGNIPETHLIDVCSSLDSPVAKKFIKDSNGTWFNERMRVETDRRKKFVKSRHDSADKRWSKNDKPLSGIRLDDIRTHVHTDMRMETETETITDTLKEVKKERNIIPPTLEMVTAYCSERKNTVNAQSFIDHYQARGWQFKAGLKMKDWQASVRTWEKNDYNKQQPIKKKYIPRNYV